MGNSSIRGWRWGEINPHGEIFGRKAVPIRDGRDGDGCLVPDPIPANPPREAAKHATCAGPCKGPVAEVYNAPSKP